MAPLGANLLVPTHGTTQLFSEDRYKATYGEKRLNGALFNATYLYGERHFSQPLLHLDGFDACVDTKFQKETHNIALSHLPPP